MNRPLHVLATCALAAMLGAAGCTSTPSAQPSPGATRVAAAPSPTPTLSTAPPLLELKLDGNLDDSGSGHFPARAVGDIAYKPGKNGQAAVIDAPKGYVEVDLGRSLDLSKGATLEAWFQVTELKAPPGLTTTQQIVAFDPLALALQSSGMVRGFQTGTDKKTIFFQTDIRQVKAGQWHHVALVADPAVTHTTVLYFDGKPQQTNAQMDVPFATTLEHPMRLGVGDKGSWPFKGLIDDVRLYDFGRTPEQVLGDAK